MTSESEAIGLARESEAALEHEVAIWDRMIRDRTEMEKKIEEQEKKVRSCLCQRDICSQKLEIAIYGRPQIRPYARGF